MDVIYDVDKRVVFDEFKGGCFWDGGQLFLKPPSDKRIAPDLAFNISFDRIDHFPPDARITPAADMVACPRSRVKDA